MAISGLGDVGYALDRVAKHDIPVAMTLGRHSKDHMLSFYACKPSGYEIEYGWRAPKVDAATWEPTRYDRINLWGRHHLPNPGK